MVFLSVLLVTFRRDCRNQNQPKPRFKNKREKNQSIFNPEKRHNLLLYIQKKTRFPLSLKKQMPCQTHRMARVTFSDGFNGGIAE